MLHNNEQKVNDDELATSALDQQSAPVALSMAEVGSVEQPLVQQPRVNRVANFSQDQEYLAGLSAMQQAQWADAVPLLQALQVRYPAVPIVDELLHEARVRAEIESQWAAKVKGRQGIQLPIRSLTSAGLLVVIATLVVAGVIYYGRVQRVNALVDQQMIAFQQAQTALAAGHYREALALFEQLLAANPTHADARAGQRETKRQMQFATDYQVALDQIAAGNFAAALTLLTTLQAQAPGYRDVVGRLAEVKTNLGAAQRLADAEAAFANGLWVTAITHYEDLRRFDNQYAAATVQEHLAAAYLKASQQMVALRPSDSLAPQQAYAYLQKALQLHANDANLQREADLLAAYITGERLVNQSTYEQGIQTLFPIYEIRPTYFGGYVAELLYRAYVGVAETYVGGMELENALAIYQRILDLELDNSGQAQQRMAELNRLLTPTPTPAPVIVYSAPVSAPTSAPTAVPVVEATPTASWFDQYRGWIAFRSTRTGSESLYLMRPDGSEIQPASAAVINGLTEHYQQQQRSPDDSQLVYVEQVADHTGANIFKAATNFATADARSRLTNYQGTEYDPVWSPDGQWIAFVANHTGNDEIWVMDQNGGQQRQLTFNDWEWDKHPSFSPDGQQLVFYTNRTGTRQIWLMRADGSNQQNLSNNLSDEWDPVWIQ